MLKNIETLTFLIACSYILYFIFIKKKSKIFKFKMVLVFILCGFVYVPIVTAWNYQHPIQSTALGMDLLYRKHLVVNKIKGIDRKIGKYIPKQGKKLHKGFKKYGGQTLHHQTKNVASSVGINIPTRTEKSFLQKSIMNVCSCFKNIVSFII